MSLFYKKLEIDVVRLLIPKNNILIYFYMVEIVILHYIRCRKNLLELNQDSFVKFGAI